MKTIQQIAVWVGVLCLLAGSAQAADWYVATNGNDGAAGTTWPTAKLTIQAGVDASSNGDTVWVSNGVYATGGRPTGGWLLTNRIVIDKPITVQSVNGSVATIIQGAKDPGSTHYGLGDAAVRCAYVGTNAVLTGFTLTNGVTRYRSDNEGKGGGAWCEASGVLNNCLLIGNIASEAGGGSTGGILNNCTLRGNTNNNWGGGASGGILNNCLVIGNSTPMGGGGVSHGTLNNCIVVSNSSYYGGGCAGGTLNSCLVIDNTGSEGGGSWWGTLNNCTLTGNTSTYDGGGGAEHSTLNNCIVVGNTSPAEPNVNDCTVNYSCTTPLPPGTGNITNDPQFVDAAAGDYRLQTNSPCINMGDNNLVQGDTDLDGNPRIAFGLPFGRVDMGAYEFLSKARYVAKSGSDAAVGTNWATAKLTIQAAVDEADNGDMVMVSNGVYATGGRTVGDSVLTNRVAIDKPIIVQSVNGPEATRILGAKDPSHTNGLGDAAVRCVYLADGAVLSGFMLTNGATQVTSFVPTTNITPYAKAAGGDAGGGGARCSGSGILNRCILVNNAAEIGGGVSFGNLYNCSLIGNFASMAGGGAYESITINCTLLANSAGMGSDVFMCGGANSIISGDSDELQFVDIASGNYHLKPASSYIDTGDNGAVFGDADLDGNPRIAYGTVDLGAYEAQLAGPGTWFTAITNGLTNDLDCVAGDGIPNLLKYATGSSPRISDELPLMSWVLNNGVPTLVLNRNPNATDITLLIQGSDMMVDGAVWRGIATNLNGSWGGATNVSESETGNPVVCTVEDTLSLLTNRFLRLKVTRP